jgi:cytochrome b561
MTLKNTDSTYGSVAKCLHWVMALWVLAAASTIYYLTWRHPEFPIPGLNYHKALGFSLLVPLAIRIGWRLFNSGPKPPDTMPRWQNRLSQISHFSLYALMLAMPVTGYLGNGAGVDYGFFRVPAFRSTAVSDWLLETFGITYAQWDKFFDTFHYGIVGPYVLSAFVLLHVGAALSHHFIQRDDVLVRMLPGRRNTLSPGKGAK